MPWGKGLISNLQFLISKKCLKMPSNLGPSARPGGPGDYSSVTFHISLATSLVYSMVCSLLSPRRGHIWTTLHSHPITRLPSRATTLLPLKGSLPLTCLSRLQNPPPQALSHLDWARHPENTPPPFHIGRQDLWVLPSKSPYPLQCSPAKAPICLWELR